MLRLSILTGGLLMGCLFTAAAQTGLSAYGVLDTVSYQPQNCSSLLEQGVETYWVNGKVVDSLTYQKCLENDALMSDCKPCWSKAYDENGQLLHEAAAYTDCLIGAYRAYRPSGKLLFTGQYLTDLKQDSTGKLSPASCGIKTGDWVYYKEDGSTIDYEEMWNNGQFLQQVPNRGKSEVWGIDLTFFGGKFEPATGILRFDMVNKLTIQPLYKNANRTAKVTGTISIGYFGRTPKKADFKPISFPYLDLTTLLPEGNDWKHEDLWVDLVFYVNGVAFNQYRLNVY